MATSTWATSAESPWTQAEAAADAANVTVTVAASVEGSTIVQGVIAEIWPQVDSAPPIDTSVLRALSFGGSYVSYASDAAGRPVGACVAFFGAPDDALLHSHAAGVVPSHAGRGVGRALKLHQRAWALDHGARTIEWTYDPLIARNAYFNLARLRAEASTYLRDFYGEMRDDRNRGFGSDRLLAVWTLTDPAVVAAAVPHGAVRVAPTEAAAPPTPWGGHRWIDDADGAPRLSLLPGRAGAHTPAVGRSTIALPPDIESLRTTDPGLATAWRFAVRDAIEGAYASGARIVGFDPAEGYLVEARP